MTFEIKHDGKTYEIHTEVGEGLTKVVFTEIEPEPEEVSE